MARPLLSFSTRPVSSSKRNESGGDGQVPVLTGPNEGHSTDQLVHTTGSRVFGAASGGDSVHFWALSRNGLSLDGFGGQFPSKRMQSWACSLDRPRRRVRPQPERTLKRTVFTRSVPACGGPLWR